MFLGDLAKGLGSIIGAATGLVIGLPVKVIATTLGITADMVKKALNAGCESYEDIKKFYDLD